MKYYQGIDKDDKPHNGGKWVNQNNTAYECYNFKPHNHTCYGYFAHRGNLSIERIETVDEHTDVIHDVTVIWTAVDERGRKIVGWYEHANVFRKWQSFYDDMLGDYHSSWDYDCRANEKDVFLIPENLRNFEVPTATKAGMGKGMGQSNIWYADTEYAREYFVPKVFEYINQIRDKCIRPFINPEELNKTAAPSNLTDEQLFQKACDLSDNDRNLEAIKIFNLLKTRVKIPAELCRIKYLKGWALSRMLLYDEAIELYKQCLHDFKLLSEDEMPENFLIADCMWNLAQLYSHTRQFYFSNLLYYQLFEIEEEVELKCDALISLMWLATEENDRQRLKEMIDKYDKLHTNLIDEDIQYYRDILNNDDYWRKI